MPEYLIKKEKDVNIGDIINKFYKGFKLINVLSSFLFFILPILFIIISFFAMVEKNGYSEI